MTYLPCVTIEPQHRDADAAIIWLHGLGANGHDFEPIVPELRLPSSVAARFIFPHAPEIPVTVNGGMRMPAWYDIKAMDLDRVVDETQLMDSANKTIALIEREIARGIDSTRIIVAGFSQGGAVAYHAALTYDKPLGGLLALSTYFATPNATHLSPANQSLPVQICHGSADPMVPEQLGQKAAAQLQQMGLSPAYQTYPMGHEVCLPQIHDIAGFITQCLN